MTVIEVDRPTNTDQGILDLLISTATTKRAIVVVLDEGDDVFRWTSRTRMRLSKLNPPLVLRYKQDTSTGKITCWAETMEEADKRRKKSSK